MIRGWLAVLFLIAPGVLADGVQDVARNAVRAYLDGDVATLRALWTPEQTGLHKAEVEAVARLRVKSVTPAETVVNVISSGDATAVVYARAAWQETLRAVPGAARSRAKNLRITLVAHDGAWKISSWEPWEAAFADQLLAQPDAVDAVLREHPELIAYDLVAILSSLGYRRVEAGDPPGAESALTTAQRVAELSADLAAQAMALRQYGAAKAQLGDTKSGMEMRTRALSLAEQAGDVDLLASCLGELARAYERILDGYPKAAELYERGLALEPQIEDRLFVSRLLNNYGAMTLRQNNNAGAMVMFERARQISVEIGDVVGEQSLEIGLAALFKRQWDEDVAVVHLLRAIALAPQIGSESRRGEALAMLADSYSFLGRDAEAKATLAEALVAGRKSGDAIALADALSASGLMHLRRRDFAAATRDFREAVTTALEGKRPRVAAEVMTEVAQTYLEAGDLPNALAAAEACTLQAQKANDDGPFVACRTIAGLAERARGNSDAALAAFQSAIAAVENLRVMIAGDVRERSRYFEHAVSPYTAAVDLLTEKGRASDAFAIAERARSRGLLDVLQTAGHPAPRTLSDSDAKTDAALSGAITRLNRLMREESLKPAADPAAIARLTGELQQARSAYASFQAAVYAAQPRLKKSEGVVAVASPADLAPLLSPSSAILEYVIGANHTTLFVVTQSNGAPKLDMIAIPVKRADLTKAASDFSAMLARRDAGYRPASRALYDLLLRPAETLLAGITTLGVIPDGALWSVPFEALVDRGNRFVVETRALYYAPSASVLAEFTRERTSSSAPITLLAVGNPAIADSTRQRLRAVARGDDLGSLPDAEKEVEDLRDLYGARRTHFYIRAAATETAIKSDIGRARVLHFATHATFDDHNPMYSQVLLAQEKGANEDGLLEAWEIMRMDLHADLAVLSACETARGRVAAGEGTIGFTWALFVAGCPSSVVSHWKVSSAGMSRLMVGFHRHLLATKEPSFAKASALRRAKVDLLATQRWHHPFYWSAAVLVGSPRSAD